MQLFAGQLGYDDDMVLKLQRMTQLIALLYVCAWLSAPIAANAAQNDLRLYADLLMYRKEDKDVAETALAAMRRHMGYLSPETVVFSLASSEVSEDGKTRAATTLMMTPEAESRDYEDNCVCGCRNSALRHRRRVFMVGVPSSTERCEAVSRQTSERVQ